MTALLTVSACSASTCLTAASTLAIISVAGMFSEVTAKFRPFFHKAISASLMDLEDKLITQLGLPTDGVTGDDTVACFFKKVFQTSAFAVFGGVKDSLGVDLHLF